MFCAIIFQLLFQPYYLVVIAKTESCIRKKLIRNQLLFHALYLSDDRVRLKFCDSTVNMPYANRQYALCQRSTESNSAKNTKFRNSQNVALSCVYHTNVGIKCLQYILRFFFDQLELENYSERAMKIALVA